jgi:cytochrome d ubiquinol oxidase subunit I
MTGAPLAAAFAAVNQRCLLEARQMQALSFAAHIALVAFAISFPAIVLFLEWLGLRTGDRLYLTLARRWTKVMATLFAVRVITGTVLSFESPHAGSAPHAPWRLSSYPST